MIPGRLATTIGAAALGVGLVIGGAAAAPAVFAQESTQAVEAPAQAEPGAEFEAQRAQAYDSFVAALASELNVDEAAVDAAVRSALRAQIASQEASGWLDADQVAEIQAMIDAAEAPLFLGMGGPGGFAGQGRMHGFEGRHGDGPHGPRGGFEGIAPGMPEVPAALPGLPGDDSASGQSMPVPAQPSETEDSL